MNKALKPFKSRPIQKWLRKDELKLKERREWREWSEKRPVGV